MGMLGSWRRCLTIRRSDRRRVLQCHVNPVPHWRLAREGPFLSVLPHPDVGGLGRGCAFRSTTYRSSGVQVATPPPPVSGMDWRSGIFSIAG